MRWLLIALLIYIFYRLVRGPRRRKGTPLFTFHFGRTPGPNTEKRSNGKKKSREDLDQIEDAAFIDITEEKDKDTT
ncbi:MAG: hypothetical protein WD094_00905 [Balneolaceae bacterium]